MGFAAPWMLLGLLGALLPLVIHLIGARRAVRVRFAALHFLLASERRIARRLRLRQWLLLAIRIGIVVGIVLMMAKPHWLEATLLASLDEDTRRAVIVLDDTASMRWKHGGKTVFATAKTKALELARRLLARNGRVAVLAVTRPGGPLARLTVDAAEVITALGRIEVSYRHARLSTAIGAARRLLDSERRERHDRGKIVVFSDWAAHGLVHGDNPRRSRDLVAPGLGLPDKRPNRAVAKLWASQGADSTGRSTRVFARVCAFDAPAGPAPVSLVVDGQDVASRRLSLPARGCGDVAFEHTFERGGSHEVVVRIASDALPYDDARYLRLEVLGDLRVLLVNGAPSPIRHLDELFYLQAALEIKGQDKRGIAVSVVTPPQLPDLGGFDVVMLCNVPAFGKRIERPLFDYVRRGGGLLVTLGDQTNAVAYASLARLLAQPLRGTAEHLGLHLGTVDRGHPMLAGVADQARLAGLSKARLRRYFRLVPQPDPSRRVLLTLEDGAPLLVERRVGRGRVALLTSTIDTDWGDLPLRPGFLPLIQRLTRYLARAPLDAPRSGVVAGSTRRITVRDSWRHLLIRGPGSWRRQYSARQLVGKRWVVVAAPRPGFYRLRVEDREGRRRPLERQGFAANVDPKEHDLAPARRPEHTVAREQSRVATRQVPLWPYLGALLLLLLVAETWVAQRH